MLCKTTVEKSRNPVGVLSRQLIKTAHEKRIWSVFFSAQALSCHKCPDDNSFNDCLANIETQSCAAGWNQCFNMKYLLKKSTGEEILYLNKQCGLDFICNQPDPNYVCNIQNTTFTNQGHELINCSSRCCTTNMCNNDDMPDTPPDVNPAPSTPLPTAAVSGTVAPSNQTGNHTTGNNTIVAPSTPRTTTATPAECGMGAIEKPRCKIIALAAVLQLAFKLM